MENNNQPSGQSDAVQFKAADISNKEQPEYFTKKPKENPLKNFIKFLWHGWHKFVTMGVALVLIAGIVVLMLWLTIWRFNTPADGSTEVSWEQTVSDVSAEAYAILNSESDTAYSDALAYFDEKINSFKNTDLQFAAQLARGKFLVHNGGVRNGLDDYLAIDESNLSNAQKYSLYIAIGRAYWLLDDMDNLALYQTKFDELSQEGLTLGGYADE